MESIDEVLESHAASGLIESKLEGMRTDQVSQMINQSSDPDELTESVEFARDNEISWKIGIMKF